MKEVILATLTGIVVGGIFSFFRLPIPAPPTLAGIMGIIGIFIGYVLVKAIFKI